MGLYRVLVGRHAQTDEDGVERVYSAGEKFETDIDMLTFNGAGMGPKFERADAVHDDSLMHQKPGESLEAFKDRIEATLKSQGATDPLDSLSRDELEKVAAEEEVPFEEGMSDDKLKAAIRASKD
jgi:hypothetical protein